MIKAFLQMIHGFCSASTRQCWFGKLSGIGKEGYRHALSILRGLTFLLLISFAGTTAAKPVEIAPVVKYNNEQQFENTVWYNDEASALDAALSTFVGEVHFNNSTSYYDYPVVNNVGEWVKAGTWVLTRNYPFTQVVRNVQEDGFTTFLTPRVGSTGVGRKYSCSQNSQNCYAFKQNWATWKVGDPGPTCIQTCLHIDKDLGCPKISVGNPVNPAIGNKYQREVDFTSSGPFPLVFARSYNSIPSDAAGGNILGVQWQSNFDQAITLHLNP